MAYQTLFQLRDRKIVRASLLLSTASLLSACWAEAAFAQPQTEQPPAAPPAAQTPVVASHDEGEIIVTARKRQESILKVPVIMTAVSGETLENFQVTSVTDLPRLVPGLVLAGNLLSIGPQVTIRGVGTSSYDPGVDQSVSLNIDGLSLGQGLAFGSGMFDVAQVEVLKGPQALFFGKSSPGGVISLRTADPTSKTEVIARAAYEFVAREMRGELIVSGPLSDTLGARIAATYSAADGYFKNKAVPILSTGAAPTKDREPQPRNFIIRGTLLWKPTADFSARLKLNHAYDHAIDAELAQLAHCPDGPGQAFSAPPGTAPVSPIPFIGGDDCKVDRDVHIVYLNPASQFFPGVPNGGVPYLENKQNYGTLELNYDLTPAVTLTSVSAYYKLNSSSLVNPTHTTAAAPTFAVTNRFHRREITEELRLNSSFKGPLNFTLGGFYEDGQLFDHVKFIRNRGYAFLVLPFIPSPGGRGILDDDRATTMDIKTWSAFGQLRYKVTDKLELAAGARWTKETRREHVFDYLFNQDITPFLPKPKISDSNVVPEATITWTPTDDFTAFGSFKEAQKSGSFKVAVPANVGRPTAPAGTIIVANPIPGTGEDNSFGPEKVRGYELGIKSRWFDRSLLMNIAFYDYYYKDLQVGGIEPAANGVPIIRTINAGKARTYGIDFDLAYHPRSIEGLSLNGSINWNKARYTLLNNLGCYANQTQAMGCNQFLNPNTGRFTAQDLSGTPMIRAPKWAINFGFDYEMPVGSGMHLEFTNNNQYSSKYVTFPAAGRPNNDNIQRSYFKIDAGVTLKGADDKWEIALIGKNLTDKIITSNCSATNFAGGIILPFGGDNLGGVNPGAMGFAEEGCFADGPGRQIWVRFTMRPFGKN
jgi:iron complex outermembrane receptor protein